MVARTNRRGLRTALFVALMMTAAPIARADQSGWTLRTAAQGHFLIGTVASGWSIDAPQTAEVIGTQFDCLTAENAFKPDALERVRGTFTFDEADRIARFAARNRQQLIGHCLCWHQQSPQWMYQDANGKPLPREQALANLREHIFGVVRHFRGRVRGWDVVNEAIDDGPGYLRDTPARKAIGDDYIEKAFEFAYDADPDVELYYNDYGIESPPKREKVLRLIGDLRAKGIRIDAVGIQGHFGLGWPALSTVDDAIKAYAKTGVKVCFSELDIDVLPRQSQSADVTNHENGGDPYLNGLPTELLNAQSERYGGLFALFARYPGVIERVTVWGVDDGQSWLNDFPVHGRTNYPLLFDRRLQPKPAFDAVIDALRAAPAK